ncbi:MAG: hypothetical protein H0X35_15495 [Pseudonocardiales bacterium]|nr:hypothetical protein [Pseudonocardiales bacterium]
MLLQTYVRMSLYLGGGLRAARPKRHEDAGLATLEWVALVIIALALAGIAGAAVTTVLNNKVAQIK